MKYEFINKSLIVDNIKLEFLVDIKKIIEFQDGLVLLLKMSPGYFIDNVFFINADGTIRWQIEPFIKIENPKYTGYTNIWEKDGELHAFLFDGFDCTLDPNTGKIVSRFLTM